MIESGESVWKTPASPLTTREEIQQHLRPPPWKRVAVTMASVSARKTERLGEAEDVTFWH